MPESGTGLGWRRWIAFYNWHANWLDPGGTHSWREIGEAQKPPPRYTVGGGSRRETFSLPRRLTHLLPLAHLT
jgi:hypothetical protein